LNYFYIDCSDITFNLLQSYKGGLINDKEVVDSVWKNLLQGKLTFLHWNKGQEMAPTIGDQGGTLLVRKLPSADPM
jgi:hypothetical protein